MSIPTRLSDVQTYLSDRAANGFQVGDPCGDDVFTLCARGEGFVITYVERGSVEQILEQHDDEAAACASFVKRILGFQHRHCVGFFSNEAPALALGQRLSDAGIPSERDAIPYGGWSDPRHRVFVLGPDVFRARALLGDDLPIRY